MEMRVFLLGSGGVGGLWVVWPSYEGGVIDN